MKFSELKTIPATKALTGDKVKMTDILGRPIVVTGYNVTKSKRNDGECLKMQFHYVDEDSLHVVFTGSQILIEQIQQAAAEIKELGQEFKLETTVHSNTGYYTFT